MSRLSTPHTKRKDLGNSPPAESASNHAPRGEPDTTLDADASMRQLPTIDGELTRNDCRDGCQPISAETSQERRRKFIDSLWLVCLLAFVAAVSIRPEASVEGDLWWHMRTGDWIIQHATVPWHDMFAWTMIGKRWIAYTWLFDVLTAKIYALGGLHGILTLTALLVLACISALVVLLSRYGSLLRAVALSAPVFIAFIPLTSPRPWLFTILFFTVELYFLVQARETGNPAWLAPIAPLFVVWANVHIQFIYGLGVIGIFALEGIIARATKLTSSAKLRSTWFWCLLLLSGTATLINPYGWRLYLVVAEYATQSVPLWFVQEMQALRFRTLYRLDSLGALVHGSLFRGELAPQMSTASVIAGRILLVRIPHRARRLVPGYRSGFGAGCDTANAGTGACENQIRAVANRGAYQPCDYVRRSVFRRLFGGRATEGCRQDLPGRGDCVHKDPCPTRPAIQPVRLGRVPDITAPQYACIH